eukprot:TRINITY_DN27339_c0_g1_i1.p1 TRINITY_DN27339_c0_g1~~TRINITY_DN27339_c0_g1_i1.p1  ORF type:complete len:614 (+),score=201.66 TRINITY_DN27339_c0_g1_i1:48-1889(+)
MDESPREGSGSPEGHDADEGYYTGQHSLLRDRKRRVVQREREAEMRQRRATEREWQLKKQEVEQQKAFRDAAEQAHAAAWQADVDRLRAAYEYVQTKALRLQEQDGNERLITALAARATHALLHRRFLSLHGFTLRRRRGRCVVLHLEAQARRRRLEGAWGALAAYALDAKADEARRCLGVVQCRSVFRLAAARHAELRARCYARWVRFAEGARSGRDAVEAAALRDGLAAAQGALLERAGRIDGLLADLRHATLQRAFDAVAQHARRRADARARRAAQERAVAAMVRRCAAAALSHCYTAWRAGASAARRARRAQQRRLAGALGARHEARLRKGAFEALRGHAARRVRVRGVRAAAEVSLLRRCYSRWEVRRVAEGARRGVRGGAVAMMAAAADERVLWRYWVRLRGAAEELERRAAVAARRVWQRGMVLDMGRRAAEALLRRYLFKLLLRIAATGLAEYQEIGDRVENALTVLKQQSHQITTTAARSASATTTASMSSASSAYASLSRSSTSPVWLQPTASHSPSPPATRTHSASLPPPYPPAPRLLDAPGTPVTPLRVGGFKGIMSPNDTPLRSASDLSVSVLNIQPNPPSPVVQVLNLSRRIQLPCDRH